MIEEYILSLFERKKIDYTWQRKFFKREFFNFNCNDDWNIILSHRSKGLQIIFLSGENVFKKLFLKFNDLIGLLNNQISYRFKEL